MPRRFHTLLSDNGDWDIVDWDRYSIDPPTKPTEPYQTPNDVPIPLQHTLREAVDSGLTADQVARIFNLPVLWVELFSRPPEGNS